MTPLPPSLSNPVDIAKRCGPAHHRACKELMTPLSKALELPRDHDCNNALRAIAAILTEQHHAISELSGRMNVMVVDVEQMNQRLVTNETCPAALEAIKNETAELERRLIKLKSLCKHKIREVEVNCDKNLMGLEREIGETRMLIEQLKLEQAKTMQNHDSKHTNTQQENLQQFAQLEKSIASQSIEQTLWKTNLEGAWKIDMEGWMAEKKKLEEEIEAKLEKQELKFLRSSEQHAMRFTNLEAFTYNIYYGLKELQDPQNES